MTEALPLALDPYLRDWLDLLLRWLHVIAAIAWIGTSFYFVLLDQSLRPVEREVDRDEGVGGELWEVHGGGFYRVQKFTVAPRRELPEHLAWFKWEAYTTWLSGFALLLVLYYLEASSRLVAPGSSLEPWQAVLASAGLLAAAWIAYDLACHILADHERLLWLALGGLTVLAAWGSGELFAPRAAWLQVGAMVGTVMAANVLLVIIPAHRELIRAKQAGREPDPAPALAGKQRSVHNNYLTLPVLLTMLAGHFSFLVGRDHAWLILVVLMVLGATARLFFNLRHGGRTLWSIAVAAALALIVLAVVLRPDDDETATTPDQVAAGATVFADAGCGTCHTLADAGSSATVGPDLDALRPARELVRVTVRDGKGGMPSFADRLSGAEIAAVAAYVSSAAGQ
jgi:uncharacterized membrane protein